MTRKLQTANLKLQSIRPAGPGRHYPAYSPRGFTLIELLVAIGIIGLVFGVITTSLGAIKRRTRDQQRIADLQTIQSALAQYYADQTFYPGNDFDIGTATVLDNDVGNPQVSAATRTYLGAIPREVQSSGPPYCYKPQASFSGGNCDNDPSTTDPSCQFYHLCARFEGPVTAPSNCTALCGGQYNWGVDPYNSAAP